MKYNKITIYHDIYIKVFSDGTVYYLVFSTDGVLDTTTNDTEFPELRIVFEESLRLNSKKDLFLSN